MYREGIDMTVLSKTSEKCKLCKYFDDCDNKRMAACALAEMPPPVIAPAAESASQPLIQDMAAKHDYRTIHAGGGMNFDIDLEDVKRQIERNLYKALNCPFLSYGA